MQVERLHPFDSRKFGKVMTSLQKEGFFNAGQVQYSSCQAGSIIKSTPPQIAAGSLNTSVHNAANLVMMMSESPLYFLHAAGRAKGGLATNASGCAQSGLPRQTQCIISRDSLSMFSMFLSEHPLTPESKWGCLSNAVQMCTSADLRAGSFGRSAKLCGAKQSQSTNEASCHRYHAGMRCSFHTPKGIALV